MQEEIREQTQASVPANLLDDARQEVRQLAGDLGQVKETIDRAWAEARQAQVDVELYGAELRSQKRRTTALWVLVLLLVGVVAGVSWYSFPVLKQHSAQLDQMAGMQDMLNAVGKRLNSAEENLTAWAAVRQKLTDQMENLENRVSSNLQTAGNQVRQMAAQGEQRIRMELNQSMRAVQSRLAKVESGQAADRARLAQLQDELVSVRRELASTRQGAEQQIAKARQDTIQDFSDSDRKLVAHKSDLDLAGNGRGHQRLDFELPVRQAQEILPGINLTVSHTSVNYQRLDGWLRLVPDGRTLWVRGHGIQQPVVFYTQRENRPYELIFTRVKDEYVSGYVLVPGGSAGNVSAPTE